VQPVGRVVTADAGEQPSERDTFFAECIRCWLQFMYL
jgi:hypothetical protein